MILGLPDVGGWTDEDRLLVVALQHHDDGVCSCGHHRDDAYDPTAAGNYEVRTYECEACATLQRHQRETKDSKHPDGEKVTVYDASDADD